MSWPTICLSLLPPTIISKRSRSLSISKITSINSKSNKTKQSTGVFSKCLMATILLQKRKSTKTISTHSSASSKSKIQIPLISTSYPDFVYAVIRLLSRIKMPYMSPFTRPMRKEKSDSKRKLLLIISSSSGKIKEKCKFSLKFQTSLPNTEPYQSCMMSVFCQPRIKVTLRILKKATGITSCNISTCQLIFVFIETPRHCSTFQTIFHSRPQWPSYINQQLKRSCSSNLSLDLYIMPLLKPKSLRKLTESQKSRNGTRWVTLTFLVHQSTNKSKKISNVL